MCYDGATVWVDWADSSGRFGGSNWSGANSLCHGGQLQIADMDGDNRDDMVCHFPLTGAKWVDRSWNGKFGGAEWGGPFARFCRWGGGSGFNLLPDRKLVLGKFNTDNRADMLCHLTSAGHRYIQRTPPTFGPYN